MYLMFQLYLLFSVNAKSESPPSCQPMMDSQVRSGFHGFPGNEGCCRKEFGVDGNDVKKDTIAKKAY